jgi:hypothetical protein
MANTRLSQDLCATRKALSQATGEFAYMMYPGKYANCSKCRIELGSGASAGNQVSLYSGNLVDLESDLRGQTRPASLCPGMAYNPNTPLKGHLINQPSCQMVNYPGVQMPSTFKMSGCRN